MSIRKSATLTLGVLLAFMPAFPSHAAEASPSAVTSTAQSAASEATMLINTYHLALAKFSVDNTASPTKIIATYNGTTLGTIALDGLVPTGWVPPLTTTPQTYAQVGTVIPAAAPAPTATPITVPTPTPTTVDGTATATETPTPGSTPVPIGTAPATTEQTPAPLPSSESSDAGLMSKLPMNLIQFGLIGVAALLLVVAFLKRRSSGPKPAKAPKSAKGSKPTKPSKVKAQQVAPAKNDGGWGVVASAEPVAATHAVQPAAQDLPPAGWYPDPRDSSLVRWFDGQQWTTATQPK